MVLSFIELFLTPRDIFGVNVYANVVNTIHARKEARETPTADAPIQDTLATFETHTMPPAYLAQLSRHGTTFQAK